MVVGGGWGYPIHEADTIHVIFDGMNTVYIKECGTRNDCDMEWNRINLFTPLIT